MSTLTPKASYTLDAAGTIGVQHENWDRADQIAGLIYTTKAVGPPANAYNGCVVVEKDTGISYRMFDNGAGGFNKKYINYPFIYYGENSYGLGIGTQGANGWSQVGDQVNYDDTWKEGAPGNGIKVQVKGLYMLGLHIYVTPNGVWPAGNVDLGYYINKTKNAKHHVFFEESGYPFSLNIHLSVVELLNVGDIINSYVYNNVIPSCTVNQKIRFSMIKPVW